ncbi:MAG: PAS domain-containing protein [Ktedonobacteraceae bacterium]|nr:PAS domain-containing protein [Ktedonobacteraceae bacterium]
MDSQASVADEYAAIMLAQVPAGEALFDAGDLRLLAANKLFCRFLEIHHAPSGDATTVIGYPLAEWLPAAYPVGATALIAIFRTVAETGRPYQTEEYAAPALNGSQMYWNWSLHPVRNEDGHIVQLIFHGSDVTAHLLARQQAKQAQTSLTNERARFRAILDQLPEGILLVEATDGSISYANTSAATILGIALQELVGVSFHQHARTHAAHDVYNRQALPWDFAIINALLGKTASSQETVVVKPDGNTLIMLSSSAPLYNEEHSITGAVIVFQDITAQKMIERQKNAFLSLASHELRTPITAIMGFAEILQMLAAQEKGLNALGQRAIAQIVTQSDHLTRLIEEMFDLTRLESAQLSLDCTWHDLHATLKKAIESQEITARGHSIRLAAKSLAATSSVMGYFDEQRVIQIVNNLLSNAIKYSSNGSEIEVGLQRTPERPDEALIWVQDHGIGIPPNEMHLIFQRFHRASNLDKSMSGLGLGLYLVKELVTRHKGRVWVESREGEGSTFYILLPLKRKT